MLSTKVTLTCNHKNCKETFEAITRKLTKVGARKLGWKVRGTKIHYCPAHRQENGYPTVTQRKAERLAKKAEKKVVKPVVKATVKNKSVAKPVVTKKVHPVRLGHSSASFSDKSKKTVRK